jgi:hypothetical protein
MMKGMQRTGTIVIQFQTGTDIQADRIEGRVVHVASGQSAQFNSLEELLAFLSNLLKEARADAPQQAKSSSAGRKNGERHKLIETCCHQEKARQRPQLTPATDYRHKREGDEDVRHEVGPRPDEQCQGVPTYKGE